VAACAMDLGAKRKQAAASKKIGTSLSFTSVLLVLCEVTPVGGANAKPENTSRDWFPIVIGRLRQCLEDGHR